MSRLRPLDRWVRWATLLALALATLAPGVSHALRHQRGDTMPWSQLCSASGGKRVLFDSPAGELGSPLQVHAFDQCAFCTLHQGSSAPPPAAAGQLLCSDQQAVAPPAQPMPHQLRLAWLAAQPRAPPLPI